MNVRRLPRGFGAWVGATFGMELGSGFLAFALTWTASAHGPGVASSVLVLTVAPAVALGLLGGVLADRFGPRRVMIATTAATVALSTALAAATVALGVPVPLLLAAATLIGVVSAFFRPASGVFPRLFATDDALGAAMSRVGIASQLARTLGPPLGGALLGALALSGVALLDALGALGMLVLLTQVRPPLRPSRPAAEPKSSSVLSGLRALRASGGATTLLVCVSIVAGAVIPAVLLGIPLIARERGWSAAEAGLIEAGWIAGGIVIGAWFAWRGTMLRPWRPMAGGLLLVAVGLGLLSSASTWPAACAATVAVGAGVVIFTAHVFPTYLLLAPEEMMSRFQSMLVIVQQAPQLAVYPVIGAAATTIGAGPLIVISAILVLAPVPLIAGSATLRALGPAQNAP
ncbi:MFS transporter [Microbacterium sp.]|uniref:MFS transporter n=1 Tax=Microbacterium sp. TaxID=51671 RepID=UPI003341ABE7